MEEDDDWTGHAIRRRIEKVEEAIEGLRTKIPYEARCTSHEAEITDIFARLREVELNNAKFDREEWAEVRKLSREAISASGKAWEEVQAEMKASREFRIKSGILMVAIGIIAQSVIAAVTVHIVERVVSQAESAQHKETGGPLHGGGTSEGNRTVLPGVDDLERGPWGSGGSADGCWLLDLEPRRASAMVGPGYIERHYPPTPVQQSDKPSRSPANDVAGNPRPVVGIVPDNSGSRLRGQRSESDPRR